MGAMKRLFLELTDEIHGDHKKNRWKDTRRDKSYTWEEAQQQVYKIANKYGTEEIIAKVFHPSNLEKYPTILKWDKIWEEKWKEALERANKNRKAKAKVVKDYIAKRWPNGVPKPETPLWRTWSPKRQRLHLLPRLSPEELRRRRIEKFVRETKARSTPFTIDRKEWKRRLSDPEEGERLRKEGERLLKAFITRNKT